jgi:hypothetical protein
MSGWLWFGGKTVFTCTTFVNRGVPRDLRDGSPLAVFSVFWTGAATFFFQIAPQLYSGGWVDPVPDPLLPTALEKWIPRLFRPWLLTELFLPEESWSCITRICIGAPIILGRCPSLTARESMLWMYLVCREKRERERERETSKRHVGKAHCILITAILFT